MTGNNRHSMDGQIQAGDVVVSHVNGTLNLFIIATVVSAVGDLALQDFTTVKGEDAAIVRGHELGGGQDVWLFGGSANAYVKAAAPGRLTGAFEAPHRLVD